ncbi:MAG: DUF6680 family protein [Amaricoccus sp.]|uniref:DUF6680 family protein n=1 Tax=Amaricoccus sp. TaxID=1872485 RepID=UPI00331543D0
MLGFITIEWVNSTILLATIFAIIYGPIRAVQVTRKLDREREAQDRKSSIFRDLMRTRAIRLDPLHVGALNLVEVEFYGNDKVIGAYQLYVQHLSTSAPSADADNAFFQERLDRFIDLLFEIANTLGYKFDKRDLERRAYSPQGWETDLGTQRRNAALLSEVLEGRRALPISNFTGASGPFPPRPETY